MDRPELVAWTAELYRFHRFYNEQYLKNALRPPVIRIVEGLGPLGAWNPALREIRIELRHVAEDPWPEVMGTLRHEMAHQFADEVLLSHPGSAPEPPHGPAFKEACARLRVEPRADGGDAGDDAEVEQTARLLARIRKLFALGASPNEHEAEAAMKKARALIVEHELHDILEDRERHFDVRQLGEVKGRHAAWEFILASILGEFFCVQPIWTPSYDASTNRRGSALLIHGADRNLEMAEYVHGALAAMLEPLWQTHRREHRIRGNRDRQRYYGGVLSGFRDKLRQQDKAVSESRELVKRGDPRLDAWFRWRNPNVSTRRVGGGSGSEAWAAGREAGQNVTLNQPVRGDGEVRRLGG